VQAVAYVGMAEGTTVCWRRAIPLNPRVEVVNTVSVSTIVVVAKVGETVVQAVTVDVLVAGVTVASMNDEQSLLAEEGNGAWLLAMIARRQLL